MAGVVAPSATVLVVALVVAGAFSRMPHDVVEAMLFPAAVNPAAWGAWNALYVALPAHRRPAIGWHGAALPLLLVPLGVVLARALHFSFVTPRGAAIVTPPFVLAYYILWKFVVGYLNRLLDLPDGSRPAYGARA